MAGANRRILFVGNLDDQASEEILHAAFIPFGPLREVQVPKEHSTQKSRGFGFVEFEDADDAEAAIDNMHDSELCGRVISVNVAKPRSALGGSTPIWETEEYLQKQRAESEGAGAGV